jgi:hypothetical protein
MSITTSPLVLLIDMDGTIIGDATPSACMYELESNVKSRSNKRGLEIYPFKNTLIRPHIESFLKFVTSECNCVCFVYTAAEFHWASKVIACFEKETGVKFSRPIFSRKDCILVNNVYRKSIQHISPKLNAVLRKRKQRLLDHNVVLIDNSDILLPETDYRRIICPTYEARVPMDVLKRIELQDIRSNANLVAKVLYRYGFITKSSYKSIDDMLSSYYLSIAKALYEESKNSDKGASGDTFWLDMESIFRTKRVSAFTKETLHHIRKALKGSGCNT